VAADAEAHDADHLSEEVQRRSFVAGLARYLARLLRLPARVAVVGPSMMPTLLDGDRCLVRRTRRVGRGDLVVFTDPEYPSRLIVKRVVGLAPNGIEVAGDNLDASRDSRSFGAVPSRSVLGIAWYRYAPAERTGRIS